ncbi:uncharacterized protein LOC131216907 isoform X2 [Magnolia sinica]|uniref:uncharacterized protein LOC131216907 isoform X2 n=1 Tax=Magnolia sinica TaxID=86752 RepID=UPI00265B63B2|nr:uncharacterized protein LOC131216907 isoform X2 [Magnolia sinica]
MAVDRNSIPKDLRPLNLNRMAPDDTPISESFHHSPRFRPVFYPTSVAVSSNPAWAPHPSAAAGTCNAPPADLPGDDAGEDLPPSKKIKMLCSFGGKILPRPSDGVLRYVGGQTRIISIRRDVGFHDLAQKMADICGQSVVIKYQLPDEDLDALVSVSCAEDLDNMMEEYEKLIEGSSDGSAKLRMFLFLASELDQSGVMQFGDLSDNGQRYVDAVNGITESVGCGFKRKESVASASSTQNSEGPGGVGEAMDSSGIGDGDGASSSHTVLSPTGIVTSPDSARLTYVPPSTMVFAESLPLNLPPISTRSAEPESERSVPAAMGQPVSAFDMQPAVGDLRPATMYQTYVDSHQEAGSYQQNPSQIGCPGTQPLPVAGSIYGRPEHLQQLPSHPLVPAVQVATTSSSPRVKPNGGAQFVQVQQMRVDPYLEESPFGTRVVHLPSDQSYKAFQQQSQSQPPVPLPGQTVERYGWRVVPPPEHLICTDGWVTHQQGGMPLSEKMVHLEDCYMCQKAIPHAHSDTLLQEQGNNAGLFKSVSDTNAVFQSHRSDESMRPRPPPHRVVVTSALAEGAMTERQDDHALGAEVTNLGFQGAGIRPRFMGHIDPTSHELASPQLGLYGLSQVPDGHHDSASRTMLLPSSVINFSDGQTAYGMFVGNLPQSHPDDALQQPSTQLQYRTVGIDIPPVRTLPFQTSETPVRDAATEYPCKHPGFVPKEGIADSCFSCDHLRPIDGRMEAFRINPPEISGTSEQYRSHIKPNVAAPKDLRPETTVLSVENGMRVTEPFTQSNAFMKTVAVPDGNYHKQIDGLPSSLEINSLHDFQPMESSQVSPTLVNPGPYPLLKVAVEPSIPSEMWHGAPTSSFFDPTIPIGEWKDEAQRFHTRRVFNEVPANCNAPFPVSDASTGSGVAGDSRDPATSNTLFSNQDPWNLQHDTHFPPPKPVRVASKEALAPRDSSGENHLGTNGNLRTMRLEDGGYQQQSDGLNKDSFPDLGRSSKGSAEEQIKQELQAVAEGVAASVFQTSTSPESVLSGCKMNEQLTAEVNVDGELHESDLAPQNSVTQIIKNNDLEELRELGSGTFGTVYHGKWRGTDVAIKRINDRCFAGKPSEQDRLRADFWNEACKLADLHHPNVVAFYGVVLDGPGGSVATVTEYMVNGSLRNALQRNDRTLDRRKRLLIAMDVAFGMEYLHGKNIVHFDLKSDNLLVNLRDPQRPICKVGDLGLSKVKCQTLISGGVRGTLPWMAPELLNGSSNLVSEKVDVFSFGIVMWELLTGEEPYADLHYGAIIGGIVSNTLRPLVPESCDPEWRSLMERCWSSEPSERPSFTEIADTLRSMAASLPPKGKSQQQQQHTPVQAQSPK